MGWVDLVLEDTSRGILIMWDNKVVELVEHYVETFLLACHFKIVDNSVEWGFTGIYEPTINFSGRLLWDEKDSLYE